ncbi:MAG: EAL domain-containing protein [Aquabacterium sp.]|nr:MAG: EAL domain-containing protein [Aquabacterium sp.]
MADNPERAIRTIRQLHDLGVQLSIDDFGTGYSSFSYLKRFQIHKLKIDQSFVRDLNTDGNSASIAQAIISMAHSLDLTVIAEGVETPEQAQWLAAHNCDEAQGYLYARPMPVDQFETWLGQFKAH